MATANSMNLPAGTSGQVALLQTAAPTYVNPTSTGGIALLSTKTASASADIQFTSLISSTYFSYFVIAENIVPGTSTANLLLQYSIDNGSTWDTTAAHYSWFNQVLPFASSPTLVYAGSNSDTSITIASSMANSGAPSSFTLEIPSPSIPYVNCYWFGNARQSVPNNNNLFGSGNYEANVAINAFRFIMSSGTITTGNFRLYGMSA